jgi:hypothetical protein
MDAKMNNMEATHTLRLYDPDFIAKLGALMEREQENYRNKNEFLTAVLKVGYEGYAAADRAEKCGKIGKRNGAKMFAENGITDYEGYATTDRVKRCGKISEKSITKTPAESGITETKVALSAENGITETNAALSVENSLKEISAALSEMSEYLSIQFKAIDLYNRIYQRLLSANYRMLLSLTGGERVMPTKVEDGFFDDLPIRFEKIVIDLKSKIGGDVK